ncbi:MAG: DnaJ domain-containing protein [Sulfurospirillum sp.]
MQISYSRDMIAVTIQEDSKTFYFLQNLIEKHFRKKIGKKEKIIVFKESDEKVQRRYFLKLISKIYKRKNTNTNKKELEKIKNSYNKNIKLSLLKANQITQHVNIKIKIEDNYVILLHFETNFSILVTYLKNYFKNHLISYRSKTRIMTIYPNSNKTVELLENLLVQRELLGSFVNFNFNPDEIETYKLVLNEKKSRKNRYFALFNLLEDYYNVLGCKKVDSFGVIRERYLKLVKQYHPDRLGISNLSLKSYYNKKFQEIQYAYEMLKIHHTYEKKIVSVA